MEQQELMKIITSSLPVNGHGRYIDIEMGDVIEYVADGERYVIFVEKRRIKEC